MPLQKLQFRPGVNRESTTLANEGGWFESDKVRFRSGSAEKIGGWVADTGTSNATLAPPTGSFWGTCRSLWNWITLSSYNLLGVGTNLKFYIQNGTGGTFYDITPIRLTTAAGDVTFAATNGSTTLTVTDAAHGAQAGDFVTYSGAIALSTQTYTADAGTDKITFTTALANGTTLQLFTTGTAPAGLAIATTYFVVNSDTPTASCKLSLTSGGTAIDITGAGTGTQTFALTTGITATVLNKEYRVVSVTSNNVYTITSTVAANASDVGNGGSATVGAYQITTGSDVSTTSVGWGAGGWGGITTGYTSTGWGSPAPAGVGFGSQLRLWSQSNYGEDLIFNPRGGGLYYWDTNANPNIFDRGTLLTTGDTPDFCNIVMVSDASRFVIGFGVNDYGSAVQNPMLIRWSDQEDYTQWTPAITNQAGSFTLSDGSQIVTTMQARQEILVWTDSALYSMQYLGAPYVWGFQILADNLSIASQNAVATANNVTYWMGVDKFYMYSGRVETLPCTLRSYVYNDINIAQASQFFAGTNEGFNEIWWYYCSANSDTIDKYVVYNYLERIWYYGTLNRSAWLDSPLRIEPMATTNGNQLVYHETGVDDGTTNPPSAITAYVQSADFDIGDGHNFGFVWRLIPDVTFDGSTVTAPTLDFTVRPRQFPGSNYGNANNPEVISSISYAGQRTYNVQQFTEQVYVRIRGRQMAFKVSSDTLGTAWQLGVPRIEVRPDGRR
jgi:hypothetical protein